MIVITNPIPISGEIDTIHSLFENGLQLLHVRKPDFSATEMKSFLSEIKPEFRPRLVLHNHYQLAERFDIYRIHFSESKRKTLSSEPAQLPFQTYKSNGFCMSTSVHSIEDFNDLGSLFEYVFLSPVFPSISKENHLPKTNLLEAVKNRTNFRTKLTALGGLEAGNIEQTLKSGFDKIALLGTIWNQNNPIQNFKSCQKIVHSF